MKPEAQEAPEASSESSEALQSWPLEGVTGVVAHRDFSATGREPRRPRPLFVQDEELFLAGVCLEQQDSDAEEVRLSLEDVGVDYEAASEASQSSSGAESEDGATYM